MVAKTFVARIDPAQPLLLEIPFDPKEVWGKARVPVKVTIHGYTYRTTTSVMSGVRCFPLRREHREAAGVVPGANVRVRLEPDLARRTVTAPAELRQAFAKSKALKDAWERLSYTHKSEIALAIAAAKKPETRARRVAKALEELRAGKPPRRGA